MVLHEDPRLSAADAKALRTTLLPPVVRSVETAFDSPFLKVMKQATALPCGQTVTFHLVQEADVAVCLPMTTEGHFVLLEEYRHGPQRALFEIPAGSVEAGEDAETAARREALEETGHAGDVQYLGSTWISAYSGARKHIFLMRNAEKVQEPEPGASDMCRVLLVSRGGLEAVLDAGELTDLDAGLRCLRFLDHGL